MKAINPCPLVPGVETELKTFEHFADADSYYYVSCGNGSLFGWRVAGPNRLARDEAIAIWNAAWPVSD